MSHLLQAKNRSGVKSDRYSPPEERANIATHAIGLIATLVACCLMIDDSFHGLQSAQKLGLVFYCASLVLMFLSSTLYHLATEPDIKTWFKRLDHCAIYLLIAGTFTPLLMIALHGPLATFVLLSMWGLAALGVIAKATCHFKYRWTSLASYFALGFLALPIMFQLYQALPKHLFSLLISGISIYVIGVLFYVCDRLPFNHAVWHCFVLVAAGSHFWLIMGLVTLNART